MTRQRRTSPSVSLFPFLAVLVCAMGALIFLLLVTTRRVRLEAVARAEAAVRRETTAPTPRPQPVPPASAAPPRKLPVAGPPPPAALAVQPEPLASPRLLSSLSDRWRRQAAAFTEESDARQARLEELRRRTTKKQEQMAQARDAAAELQEQTADVRGDRMESNELAAALASRQASVAEEMIELQAHVRRRKQELAAASSKFRVVPYDGQSGTTRRPITIVCSEDGLRLLPEDILLGPREFKGFTARFNPLLAGTRALAKYWNEYNRRQPAASAQPEPYVLLLVRPSGSLAYYVARRMLSQLDIDSGYELIAEDWQLEMPEPDPAAQAACRTAIDRVLSERQRIAELIGSRRAAFGASTRSGGSNRFDLDDLDSDSVGSRSWERPEKFEGQQHRDGEERTTTSPRELAQQGGGQPARASGPARPIGDSEINPRLGGEGGGASLKRPDNGEQRGGGPSEFAAPGAETDGHSTDDDALEPRAPRLLSELDPANRALDSAGDARAADRPAQLDPNSGTPTAGGLARGKGKVAAAEQGRNAPASSGAGPERANQPAAASGGGRQGSHQPSPLASPALTRSGSSAGRRATQRSRWGLSSPSAKIGFERPVRVEIDATQVVVAGETAIPTGRGESREELLNQVAAAIDEHARSWGKPPEGFYWIPAIEFSVSPGGNLSYERLNGPIGSWGLPTEVDFTLGQPQPSRFWE